MVSHDELQEVAPGIIAEDRYPPKNKGQFGPSQVSGCPLKVYLDKMTDHEVTMNSWMFAGSAVHYYLQQTDILQRALHEAGYHWVHTDYEQTTEFEINDDVSLHGSADVVTSDGEDDVIYDIKFSSLPADSGHGRIYKYFSQANTYAHMFDADEYGLIMINSKSQNLRDSIVILEGQMSEDNWEIVKQKAVSIFNRLEKSGYYDLEENDGRGRRFDPDMLAEADQEFWADVVEGFDTKQIPSYDKECQYCPHADYCPIEQGVLGGLNNLIDDVS